MRGGVVFRAVVCGGVMFGAVGCGAVVPPPPEKHNQIALIFVSLSLIFRV